MSSPAEIRSALLILLVSLFCLHLKAQRFSVEPLVSLPDQVNESSGIIFLNDRLISHNDSGGEPILYEIDTENGSLVRELVVKDASNVDWEDLTFDQQYIYIADIGNNNGDRKDLRIYRILLANYFQTTDNTLEADTINFSYEDQSDFDSNLQTNFDGEAIISFEDSLYIFTKNWGDFHSNIYALPKTPGTFEAKKVGRINSEGLVTGAVYNPASQEIMLTGYTLSAPFLFRISAFSDREFDRGDLAHLDFTLDGSFQIEGIEAINDSEYFITSESNALGRATLLQVRTDFVVGLEDSLDETLKIYPNPVKNRLNIGGLEPSKLESVSIFNALGRQIAYYDQFQDNMVNLVLPLGHVDQGLYHLHINSSSQQIKRKLIIAR